MTDQLDFRAALFGHRSRVSSSTNGNNTSGNANSMEMKSRGPNPHYGHSQQLHKGPDYNFEQENEKLVEDLDAKVSILKQVTIDINRETLASNAMLDDLDSKFDNVGDSIVAATKKIKKLISSGGSKYMFYMVLFIFSFFFFIYFFLR